MGFPEPVDFQVKLTEQITVGYTPDLRIARLKVGPPKKRRRKKIRKKKKEEKNNN